MKLVKRNLHINFLKTYDELMFRFFLQLFMLMPTGNVPITDFFY